MNKFLAASLSLLISLSSLASDYQIDVALHDGRQIKVERTTQETTNFKIADPFFGLPTMPRFEKGGDISKLKFVNPDTLKTITWTSEPYYTPVLLDIVAGVPYLVVYGFTSKKTEAIYGCPELPYFYLKYESGFVGKWLPVPLEKAPAVLRVANLLDNYGGDGGLLQRVIPRTYEEWNYKGKNNHRNDRAWGDCRPPRVPPPPLNLPLPTAVSVESLEINNYEPERVFIQEDWAQYQFYLKGEKSCKSKFAAVDADDDYQGERFTGDATGLKRVPYSIRSHRTMGVIELCDDYILFISHMEIPGSVVVTKYTLSGDLVYRVSFKRPESINGYVGHFRIPSLRSELGYFNFEWIDFIDRWNEQKKKEGINQKDWYVRRTQKLRFLEP